MPWIRKITLDHATGALKRELEKPVARAGRVFNIVQIMSLNARVMKASMDFYGASMFGKSPLSRAQREMLATVVSRANHCHY